MFFPSVDCARIPARRHLEIFLLKESQQIRDIDSMLGQRRRRCTNIGSMFRVYWGGNLNYEVT